MASSNDEYPCRTSPPSVFGYPPAWFTADSKRAIEQRGLTCFVCNLVLRFAVQVTCGARFCQACVESLLSNEPPITCPSCENEHVEEPHYLDRNEVQPDNFCRNQIKKLTTYCPYQTKYGCPWTGKVLDYEEHESHCEFGKTVRCECGQAFSSQEECERHKETDCPQQTATPSSSQLCSVCHHTQVTSAAHIEQICKELRARPVTVSSDATVAQPVEPGPRTAETGPQTAEPGPQAAESRHQSVEPRNQAERPTGGASAESTGAKSLPTPSAAASSGAMPIQQGQYEALLNKYKANTSLITVLFNEVKTCSHKLTSDDPPSRQEHDNLKQRVSVLETLARDLQNKIPGIERVLGELPLSNVNGKLIWRIDDIERKREEARTAVTPALYSPPFSTSEAGYKMCSRLYLNGDGIGKDSHVSLFFVLMRGRYDAILSWPFTHRVTMTLLDQSGQGSHVQEKFRPDPNSTSFQRPRSEMNIATGCPRFISKADLERRKQLYVRDNIMFIQILVE